MSINHKFCVLDPVVYRPTKEEAELRLQDHRLFIHDRGMNIVFRDKVFEADEEIKRLRKLVNYRCEWIVAQSDETLKWLGKMLLSIQKERVEKAKKERDKWQFYHDWSLGKVDIKEINLIEIKKIPIGNFINGPNALGARGSYRETFICPFHGEKTPSFTWYKDSNSFYCYGCAEAGDVIAFYMKMYKVDFKEAIKQLSNLL